MQEVEQFEVTFKGKALETHEIDVKELAPAMLALAELLEETNTCLNGNRAKVTVKLKGSFKSGSINIGFALIQDVYAQILHLLQSNEFSSAINLLNFLGFTCKDGLIQLLFWVKNRPIKKIKKIDEKTIEIQVEEEKRTWNAKIGELFLNTEVRKKVEKMTIPLTREGIEEISIKHGKNKSLNIRKNDYPALVAPIQSDELINEQITETTLQMVSVVFQEDNKWKFTDGQTTFYAPVLDQAFLSKVNNSSENFAKSDLLKVKLKRIQYKTDKGLKADYEVLEVLEHNRHEQLKLLIDEGKKKKKKS